MNMSSREFIALGTGSQVPTRERSHNSYLLRWDGEVFLLDPGEGTQRQLTLAGVPACSIYRICITHFHGDHCLGLAGVVQRLSLDRCDHPVHLYYPESGQQYIERLCNASVYDRQVELIFHPIRQGSDGMIELYLTENYALFAHGLEHSIPAFGFRLEESAGVRFSPEKLELAGVRGPMVGELQRQQWIKIGEKTVHLKDVTVHRPGSVFAFIMDTSACKGALALARDADLLVMEATYTAENQELARHYRHCTAADAARTAAAAGAHRLAMTHFSQRSLESGQHVSDAREIFSDSIALNDLDRVEIPRR
jgi:ribonuclease Z